MNPSASQRSVGYPVVFRELFRDWIADECDEKQFTIPVN